MQTRLLTEAEYKSTFTAKMHDVTASAIPVIDIWPYVDSIPLVEFQGHGPSDGEVEIVYHSDDDCFEHVLVKTTAKNVFLAVVVNLLKPSIEGHWLLDLNSIYGLT